jgi:hypothetical protein
MGCTDGAAAGMAINPPSAALLVGSPASVRSVVSGWVDGVVKLWKFRAMLMLVDVGFFLTQVRLLSQSFESHRSTRHSDFLFFG